jgi:flagellar hook-associated protein 1
MSISGLLDIGNTALAASQAALTVTSNNIANINTPGYSKQDIVLSIASPASSRAGDIGRGVTVDGIRRSYDRFLEAQLLAQQQSRGKSAVMDQALGQIESLVNEQQGSGLSNALNDFFNAWNDVATAPDSSTARTVVLQKANNLARSASLVEKGMTDAVSGADASIADTTTQINLLASDVADLNTAVMREETGKTSGSAVNLRDQRDAKLIELAKLTDFNSYEAADGSITVTVGMRTLVSGSRTNAMTSTLGADGDRSVNLDGIDITGAISGGALGGLIQARDDIRTGPLTELRKLVASVTQQVNALHTQGYALDNSQGNNFFNPLQLSTVNNASSATISASITSQTALTLDEYAVAFDAGGNYTVTNKQTGASAASGVYVSGATIALPGMNLVITGATTQADSFTVSPLTTAVSGFGTAQTDPAKVAASSTLAGLPGDNGIASLIAQLSGSAVANLGNATFSDYYGGLVSGVGSAKSSSSDGLAFDDNLLSALQTRRDSVSAVSLDEEAANLIRYQRSYEAAAKVIGVADEMLKTLLNL